MKDTLFDSDEKRQAAIVAFKTGKNTPFWVLMEKILEANIVAVTEQILAGGKKKEMDRLRDVLRAYEDVKDTPATIIKNLTVEKNKEPNLDPYYSVTEMKDLRKKAGS